MDEQAILNSVASNPGSLRADPAFFQECFGSKRRFNAKVFEKGCLCPALVISTSPYLLAVYTNLANRSEPFPCVRIIEQPLEKMTGGPPKAGQRLATCALYYASSSEQRWATFDPVVVNCATRDRAAIATAEAAISESEWERLVDLFGKTSLPYEPDVQFLFTAEGELSHREVQHCYLPEKQPRFAGPPMAIAHGSIPILTLIFSPFLLGIGWVLWDSYQKNWIPVQQEPGMGVLMACLLALYLWLAWLMWRMKVTIYQDGFSWQGPRSAYDGARWEDVSHYAVQVTSSGDNYGLDEWLAHWLGRKTRWRFSSAHAVTTLIIHLVDGRSVQLKSNYFRPYRMFERIIEPIDERTLKEALLRERHGVPMSFGSMYAYPGELRWGNASYPYATSNPGGCSMECSA